MWSAVSVVGVRQPSAVFSCGGCQTSLYGHCGRVLDTREVGVH